MTARPFLDTNILVYALAARAIHPMDVRTHRAEDLLALGGIVSVQILNEYVDVASHKLKMNWSDIDLSLRAVEALCGRATPLTAETHSIAIKLSARCGFRIYDSLILASALEAGCDTLYTEDLQHGQVIEGVRIENPFLG